SARRPRRSPPSSHRASSRRALRHPKGRVAGQIDRPGRTKHARAVKEDVADLLLRFRSVPGDEHTDAMLECPGHRYFAPADERHVGPAEPGACGVRREGGVQVVGHGEPDVTDVFGPHAIQLHDGVEHLERRVVDRARVVVADGRRAADATHRHQPFPAAASIETNARRASGLPSAGAPETAASAALPTTTASATPPRAASDAKPATPPRYRRNGFVYPIRSTVASRSRTAADASAMQSLRLTP